MSAARDLPRMSGDARVAASVTLVAVVICASAALALTPRAGNVSGPTGNRLAQASPQTVVKIVNATPRSERCEEQTWPYFDRRCLPLATQSPPPASMPTIPGALPVAALPAATVQPASPPTARQVTGGAPATQTRGASGAATTGIAPRDERALSPSMRAEREDIQRRDELLAQWEAEEFARRAEEERLPEPRRRKARRHYHHQFGFFGLGFRF